MTLPQTRTDDLRTALAYLRCSITGDRKGIDVLTTHTDLEVLAENLALIARAALARPAQHEPLTYLGDAFADLDRFRTQTQEDT